MPNVLVWGKTRELIAGEPPAGMPIAEVSSLEEAKSQGDSRGTLLLTDLATIETHEKAIQKWLRGGGSAGTLLVVVAEAAVGDEVLRRFPFVDDLLVKPVTAGRLRLRLDRAFDALHNRRVVSQLEEALKRKGEELDELNKIGVALSAERDINKLLEQILRKSRDITSADAGSLYLVERGKDQKAQTDDLLRFKLTQNDSVVVPFEESTMSLSQTSIAGYVASTGEGVNLADAYNVPPGSPFQISRSFDEQSGYRTKSMLVVPMRDHKDKVIGVVQLINKKRDPRAILRPVAVVDDEVMAFTEGDKELVTSLASQAAVAFENARLIENIKRLFESFVQASVITIEKRDPTTSGHSGRVAILTVELAERVDAASTGPYRDLKFSRDQIQEIRYASLLHDFGKVGVKERYLLKEKKLWNSNLDLVVQRFEYIQRTQEVAYLKAKMRLIEQGASREKLAEADEAYRAQREDTARLLEAVRAANVPAVLKGDNVGPLLDEMAKRRYADLSGKEWPYLTEKEIAALSVTRGSLTVEERDKINEHVKHTYAFLRELPWTTELEAVPDIAHAHHEKLDGTGYPKGLKEPAIPIQSKMMTVSDIYDALTANDRPYKPAVAVERALDILKKEEAGRGKLDAYLVDLFIEAKVYEKTPIRGRAEAETLR